MRRLPLTFVQRHPRLRWYLPHSHRNVIDRSKIVFIDESHFEPSPDDQRRRVWRRPGQRCGTNLTVFRQTGLQPGVMVWNAISFHSRTSLVVIHSKLTALQYVDEVLRPVGLPFMSRYPGITFKQYNARSHTAHFSTDCISTC